MTEKAKSGFQPGDIVKLKSGGPRMTVERIGVGPYYDEVNCVWFCRETYEDGTAYHPDGEPLWGDVFGHAFMVDILERVED